MEQRSGVTFIDRQAYSCPHCRVELTVEDGDGWRGWRRCPACDRPLLPPDPADRAPAPWEATSSRDYLTTGYEFAEGRDFGASPPFGSGRGRRTRQMGWRRIILLAGLAVSIVGMIFAVIENSNVAVAATGLAALIFVLFLVRPAPKR